MRDLAGAPGRDTNASAPLLYTAEEAAAVLRCSAWWLKKEAREGRAPHTRTGGAYRFTAEHIDAVIRLREVAVGATRQDVAAVNPVRRAADSADAVPLLRARPPRRPRVGVQSSAAA
ncbi:helix-turn-helix domain-containing protein [Dactylosporangium sp. CA-139114]|uniref:helix-turn-helix domain-containing protein n=1 Tax=Dactylosporangium sp. CA-139114 TaxID=3239931 RepID=UPI003D9621F8